MISGIYQIRCLENGRVYIGSSINLKRRRNSHFSQLRRNVHYCFHLQRAFNKYGEESFVFEIVEECQVKLLIEKEQFWIDKIPQRMRFNTRKIAESNFGSKMSKEICEKRSARLLGHRLSEETKKKISQSHLGKSISQETKNKLSKALKGKFVNEKTRKKHSKSSAKTYCFISPEGNITEITNLAEFCRNNNLTDSAMNMVYYGNKKSHKGWRKIE